LYAAKQNGRNQTVVADCPGDRLHDIHPSARAA
jgi:hypothetical protein